MSHKQNEHHPHDKKGSHSHSHDTFEQVSIDDGTARGHFDLVVPLVNEYFKGKFIHVKLQHIYAKKNGHQDWFYWAQVNSGDHGDHHDWTIKYEIINHLPKLESCHPGHVTFFGAV